jgi:hypothetical protein
MRIDPAKHEWITAPETLAVLAALGEARFVGGPRRATGPKPTGGVKMTVSKGLSRDKKKKKAPP